jgi:hypothetical protein
VKKAIADLELSLMHLQQDVDIPEVYLGIHPLIKQAVDKAVAAGKRVDVQDLEKCVFSCFFFD